MTDRPTDPATDQPTDPYAALGLDPSASQEQIRHAYLDLVRRLHPDTRDRPEPAQGVSSDEALRQVFAAYALLSDAARRAAYDQRVRRPDPHLTAVRPRPRPRAGSGGLAGQPPIQAGPVRWRPLL